jgi:hypothetical protein
MNNHRFGYIDSISFFLWYLFDDHKDECIQMILENGIYKCEILEQLD